MMLAEYGGSERICVLLYEKSVPSVGEIRRSYFCFKLILKTASDEEEIIFLRFSLFFALIFTRTGLLVCDGKAPKRGHEICSPPPH